MIDAGSTCMRRLEIKSGTLRTAAARGDLTRVGRASHLSRSKTNVVSRLFTSRYEVHIWCAISWACQAMKQCEKMAKTNKSVNENSIVSNWSKLIAGIINNENKEKAIVSEIHFLNNFYSDIFH